MQGLNNMEPLGSDQFPTAEQLKDITATPEELFEKQVEATTSNIMSTMVRLAQEQGRTNYGVQLRVDTSSQEFIDAVANTFKELGYVVSMEDSEGLLGENKIPVKNVTISWD